MRASVEGAKISQILFSPFLIPSTTTNFNFSFRKMYILCYIHKKKKKRAKRENCVINDGRPGEWPERGGKKKIEMKFNSSKAISCSTCV
jgi:hypothetical protein